MFFNEQAEEWAGPMPSMGEVRAQKIGTQILTRAAMLLLEQLGIRTVEDYDKHFKNHTKNPEESKEKVRARAGEEDDVADNSKDDIVFSPISPMSLDEFQVKIW
uniref:Uncharacterized protein n=1 Tax=Caenorhabditis japonica TaxID=281687 RepID=A0A8R1HIS0_CAEJA